MYKWSREIKRAIALVSDVHCGSPYAIWPEGIKRNDGTKVVLNKVQKAILKYWNNQWMSATEQWKVDTVIDLSDCTDGLNKKAFGHQQVTVDLNLQVDAYKALMEPLIGRKPYLVMAGSDYHESQDLAIHYRIAQELGGQFGGIVQDIPVAKTDFLINLAHGGGASAMYRTTMMDREGLFNLAASAEGKLPKAKIIARGHWHSWIHIHLRDQHIIQLPCWQAYRAIKKYTGTSYAKHQPDIGGVILLVDNFDRVALLPYIMKENPVTMVAGYPEI